MDWFLDDCGYKRQCTIHKILSIAAVSSQRCSVLFIPQISNSEMYDLSGKNVVYVGGFSGVGYQVCRMLMKKKITYLMICGRMENVEMMRKLQAENTAVKVMFVHMNLMDRNSMEQAVKQIVGVMKHIDVLINGAGVLLDKDVETTVGVNLIGVMNMTLMCMPYMDKTQMGQGGLVVNISSVYGMEPSPVFPVYVASKHGVVGFTRSMGMEPYYQHTGIMFMCICPGLTTTETMMNLRDKIAMGHQQQMGDMIDAMSKAKQQTPEECAVSMVKAMEMMKNGGVYMCNMGQLKEVMPTNYWHM